tara:strand:+ start:1551 stop:2066 length:516 start_codon:yes stop_codon:yes gene_type:complete
MIPWVVPPRFSMVRGIILKPYQKSDCQTVREIYSDAVNSLGNTFYTHDQIHAWSHIPWIPGLLDNVLVNGKGWISYQGNEPAAFCIRYPSNRVALLYCKGEYSRKGHATKLLSRIEIDAINQEIYYLSTEASFFSYPLFLRLGWSVLEIQNIFIAGVPFERFRMSKTINFK